MWTSALRVRIRTRLTQLSRRVSAPARLVLGLGLLVLLGTLLLMLPAADARQLLSWNEAAFTAVSALTVTGLSVIVPGSDLTLFGQIILLLLIQIGGIGFMVIATLVYRAVGLDVRFTTRLALRDALGISNLKDIESLVRRSLLGIFLIECVGTLALFIHWQSLPLTQSQRLFFSMFHAISAFCNAGFDLFLGLPQFPSGLPNDTGTMMILGVLITLGGIGIPVITNVLTCGKTRKLNLHTRLALGVSLGLSVLGGAGIFFAESGANGVLHGLPVPRQMALAVFQSVSARTAGFAFLPNFAEMTAPSQLMLMTLMFIGASPASMGGGIKTTTFAILVLSLVSYARGEPDVLVRKRLISKATLQKSTAVLTAGLFVIITATWLLTLAHPKQLTQAFFEVISAFATCGLTLNFTATLNVPEQLIIMAVMFWGRLGALTLVAAIALPSKRAPVSYAEETVLVG